MKIKEKRNFTINMGILNADGVRTPTREEAEACAFKLVKTAWQSLHSNHPNSPGKTRKEHVISPFHVTILYPSSGAAVSKASRGYERPSTGAQDKNIYICHCDSNNL